MQKREKRGNRSFLRAITFTLLTIFCCVSVTMIVVAATNHVPKENAEGGKASVIAPVVSGTGDKAETLIPEVVPEGEKLPFEPFIPEFIDGDPFIDLDDSRDYSTQYNYTHAVLSPYYGRCDFANGVYTAVVNSTIYANRDAIYPFPYGTISADIMNNGSDTGIVFGLSSNVNNFWEGNGVSYYFAFINFEGILFLGRTHNGVWSSLAYTDISGFNESTTYNLKVVYRVEKIILFLNDVPMLSYRTGDPLTGTGWGFRTGNVGATVSNFEISNKVTMG